jgi:hypothetical protein
VLYHITYLDHAGNIQTARQGVTSTGNPTRDRSAAMREAKYGPNVAKVLRAVKLPKPLTEEDYARDRERTQARHTALRAAR